MAGILKASQMAVPLIETEVQFRRHPEDGVIEYKFSVNCACGNEH